MAARQDAHPLDAEIGWKIGVELELLAPRGSSRRALAEHIAQHTAAAGAQVRPYFLHQEEPSEVPGMSTFNNLTLAFEVTDGAGGWLARCADDLTLQDDLDRRAPPRAGWFRIVSDDRRLLNLVARHGRADAGLLEALGPTAALFGTVAEPQADGMVRVRDELGAAIAIGAPLPGERERPCELITAPITARYHARIDALLAPARALGFTIPAEAATHIHFDNAALHSARTVCNLINLQARWGPTLRWMVGTNPRCRRLGDTPAEVVAAVNAREFLTLPWSLARARLAELGLSKYRDLNLKNLAHDIPGKPTAEVRILPGYIDTEPVLEAAALFAGLLRAARRPAPIPLAPPAAPGPDSASALIEALQLPEETRRRWHRRCSSDAPASRS